ncbi:hypothetical protein C8J57DRAFT_1072396, partial [Mycena rebaudengoi]
PVAIISVLWMEFMSLVLLFAAIPQVNTQDINYSVVVVGGFIALAMLYYYFARYGGKTWFSGPRRNLDAGNTGSTGRR